MHVNIRRISQPDTEADLSLRECLRASTKRSFIMIAGAGSGKTTSLVKALSTIVREQGAGLKRRRQRVACITYTDVAAREIWADVGSDPCVHVSTIHSFMWMIVRGFQKDIHSWVVKRISEKLGVLREQAAGFGPRVQARTREKNRRDTARYEREIQLVSSVRSFVYGAGSNYPKGILGHDDIIRMTTELLKDRPLLRMLVSKQFPYLFVDESQDTTAEVVESLRAIELQMRGHFCLGFFGDPMQQIYATGVGEIVPAEGWLTIRKPENFRCSASVLAVANAIRSNADGLVQTRGRTEIVDGSVVPVAGSARIFIISNREDRQQSLIRVRHWLADANGDVTWHRPDKSTKVLVIVHRMAATRLGFGQLYAALNDRAPDAFKNGFLDASAWPLRPLVNFALPLSDAITNGREFEAMAMLRQNCELLKKGRVRSSQVPDLLRKLRRASLELVQALNSGRAATVREVLVHLRDTELIALDPRILSYLEQRLPPVVEAVPVDEEESVREANSMEAFLDCPASQLWGYQRYLEAESPFSTQQGIKGTEFPKVIVVLDDEEGTHNQFSYDKYFGIAPLSPRDIENEREGKDTVVERTRRLFYVCCTRALSDLAVVLFCENPAVAKEKVLGMNIFRRESVISLDA